MPIYIDESGGLSAGAMTMAGVEMEEGAAHDLLQRFRAITGLHGELKGSRIDLVERALVLELLERFGGRARICVVERTALGPQPMLRDLDVYVALLTQLVGEWLPEAGGCARFVIDEGRYDLLVQEQVRLGVARLLESCGAANMVDSRTSAGVQVADVVANCFFNLAVHSSRAAPIQRIVAPFLESHILRSSPLRLPIVGKRAGTA
ncbi:MAG TPA: DUF3800 domain-containing protein [Sphingobium sp.]|uniref:DUF3800 domain-containing protein n=1 Tax=Sphingobium sp. TaxID=1912891 RepID=UPI002ED49916